MIIMFLEFSRVVLKSNDLQIADYKRECKIEKIKWYSIYICKTRMSG